jgi:uncharacterized SAM-binding protein YcdF (DUF218 family)
MTMLPATAVPSALGCKSRVRKVYRFAVGRARPSRLAVSLAVLAAMVPVAAWGLPIGPLLVPPLEARIPAATLQTGDSIDGIISLGGGFDRAVEAVRLAQIHPGARLVISGYGEEAAHRHAHESGISAERLVLEPGSRNTFENAVFTRRILGARPGERWLLVTSSAHMPRAIGSFRKAGLDVMPWPVGSEPEKYRLSNGVARHEWLGLIAYRLMGRTDALFPGPRDGLVKQPPR